MGWEWIRTGVVMVERAGDPISRRMVLDKNDEGSRSYRRSVCQLPMLTAAYSITTQPPAQDKQN
jgi:hypothetical protein